MPAGSGGHARHPWYFCGCLCRVRAGKSTWTHRFTGSAPPLSPPLSGPTHNPAGLGQVTPLLLLLLTCFSRVRLCATPQMAAHQAQPSLGFSRQEHWSGLPFPLEPLGQSRRFPITSSSTSASLTTPLTVWLPTNCRILKGMGMPDHRTCLLRNLYAGQEAIVRTGHGTTDWFQIGKGVCQGCILSPCLFNFICRAHHAKRWAGRSTSWNQDCWEKYQ